MDPNKNQTLRISFYSKVTKKPKFKQVKVKNFESAEAAKVFLEGWKAEQIELDAKKFNDLKELKNDPGDVIDSQPVVISSKTEKTEKIPKTIAPNELPEIEYTPFKITPPDFNKSGGGRTILIIAASSGGKTTLTKFITRKYLDKPKEAITIFMSPSLAQEIYAPIRKNKNIISLDYFNERMINDLGKIQKRTSMKYKGFVVVLDDIIGNGVKKSDEILQMLLTYRNLNISCLVNSQGSKLISKDGRNNANNIYILRQNNLEAMKEVIELFVGNLPPFAGLSWDMKVALFMKATKDNGIIYLDALNNTLYFHHAIPED